MFIKLESHKNINSDNIIEIFDDNSQKNNDDEEKEAGIQQDFSKLNIHITIEVKICIKFIFLIIILLIFIISFHQNKNSIEKAKKDKTDIIEKDKKTDIIEKNKKTDIIDKDKTGQMKNKGLDRESIINKYKGKKLDIKEDNRNTTIYNGLEYIDKCVNNIIDQEIYKYPENHKPLLSIVIPVYNAGKTITYSVRSIQNQNLVDFEIILVNDFSNDNSSDVMINLQKEDSRIKIMNNTKNMGTLYSRSIGALASKGDYILSLDNDDLFIAADLFEILYVLASQDNFDVIAFRAFRANSFKPKEKDITDEILLNSKHNLVLTQPRLGLCTIYNRNKLTAHDIYVWGKIIKTEIYQKSVNSLGKERYSEFITWSEDNIMTYIIYNFAKSYKSVRKYGIFHIRLSTCESRIANSDRRIAGKILFSDVIYDFSKNKDKNLAIDTIFGIMNEKYFNVQNNKKNSDNLKKFIKKMLDSKYISEYNKKRLKERYSKIKFYPEPTKNF